MKYCRKCGAKMTDDALFCSKCGCKVIEPKDLDVTEDAVENEQAEGNESANTPDLDLQPVVSQPVKSVSEENSEAKSSYGRTRVQYSTPSNTPPLLDELSSMYKNISRSSLILSIVDMIGTIDWILLGIAFVSWDRLLIPGILLNIYGVGMWVAAVMNFKEYLKARKVSNQLHNDPPQTLREVIDNFRDEAENEKLFRSLSTVDTVNIFFRFYNVGKYMIKYRCINDYLSENKDSLDIILKAYSQKSVQSNNPDEELRKQKEAFSVRPKTDYQKKLKIRIRAIIVGIILIILIPVLIVLNKSMRDPEYANYIGEKYGHTNTATQQNSKIQSYTAEEFIKRYNELASYFDGVVDTFDYSTGKKEKHKDSLWIYSFSDSRKEKSLSLMVDCSSTSEKVVSVSMSFYISEDDAPVYRYDVANAITVFIKNLPLADASAACEQTVEKGEYTDSQIAGITLYYEKDSSYNTENWFILLSGEDSTTVQSSNQTDIKTEESSKSSETSSDNETSDNDYSSELEELEQERINTLNELKTSADKMLHESYNKNDYEATQQKEIESIINKYMEQINNATVANDVNKLYAAAINEINNVKTKKQLAGKSSQAAPVKLYADKLFDYNGATYYTPSFSGKGDTGNLDFFALGNKYKALTLPDMYDSYGRQVNIDSFIIVGDVVYFTDQEAGSVSPLPAKLYMMNLDGSACKLIAEDVDVRFYCEGNIIYFASCYSSDDSYTYSISSGEKKYIGKRISLDNSDMIFYSNDRVEYNGGIYYKENLVYYREDKASGSVQVVGHSVGGGQQ